MQTSQTRNSSELPRYPGRIWGVVSWSIFCLFACTAKMQSQYLVKLLSLSVILLGSVVLLWRYFAMTRRRRNIYARVLGYVLFGAGSLFLTCTPIVLQFSHKETFFFGFFISLAILYFAFFLVFGWTWVTDQKTSDKTK